MIPQKREEQARSDVSRNGDSTIRLTGDEQLYRLGLLNPVTVPWSTLISLKSSRDAICSLHWFYGDVSAHEQLQEHGLNAHTYRHGGCFCIPANCMGEIPHNLVPVPVPVPVSGNDLKYHEIVNS